MTEVIKPQFALFLGRRQIAENLKSWLEEIGFYPVVTIYDDQRIYCEDIRLMESFDIDYIFCIQYHNIIPLEILNLPKKGCINVHPAYLPYNRGWNTPSWMILNGTPCGATMHYMTDKVDAGDIIYQETLKGDIEDTAHTLYKKILELEETVFKKGFLACMNGTAKSIPQVEGKATVHKRGDLKPLQEIDPFNPVLIKLKALTTNDINEAAYFINNNYKYAVQVTIKKIDLGSGDKND